nr:NBS-containing resistance-like protein [Tanacetum cinerariifolium]
MNCHVATTSPLLRSHKHALSDPYWKNDTVDEYDALISNITSALVPRSANVNVVRSISQQQMIDCDENFSPVVNPGTIRTVLSLAVSQDWPIHQPDVKNAFLHSHLSETVYMHQPPGSFLSQLFSWYFYLAIDFWIESDGTPISDPTLLRSLAGDLQYLTFTRSDLSYAGQQVRLYMHDPHDTHFTALKRILCYVHGTIDYGLQLHVSSTAQLTSYTNVDWAGCPVTRRSTSRYCVFLGDNLLSWSAKRQVTLSCSSDEAEYRGIANVVDKKSNLITKELVKDSGKAKQKKRNTKESKRNIQLSSSSIDDSSLNEDARDFESNLELIGASLGITLDGKPTRSRNDEDPVDSLLCGDGFLSLKSGWGTKIWTAIFISILRPKDKFHCFIVEKFNFITSANLFDVSTHNYSSSITMCRVDPRQYSVSRSKLPADSDMTSGHFVSNKVNINLDVLGVLILHRISGHVDSTNVIIVDIVAAESGVCNSQRRLRIQDVSVTTFATPRYSASGLDLDKSLNV